MIIETWGDSSVSPVESASEEHPPGAQGETGDKRLNAICNSFKKNGPDASGCDETGDAQSRKRRLRKTPIQIRIRRNQRNAAERRKIRSTELRIGNYIATASFILLGELNAILVDYASEYGL